MLMLLIHVTPVVGPCDQVIQPQPDDGKVKIKWGFDDSEGEVTSKELRLKAPEVSSDGC